MIAELAARATTSSAGVRSNTSTSPNARRAYQERSPGLRQYPSSTVIFIEIAPGLAGESACPTWSSLSVLCESGAELGRLGVQIEVAARENADSKRRGCLLCPSFQMLAAYIRIVGSSVGADREGQGRVLGID